MTALVSHSQPAVLGVIPARWASSRLPGKMLADLEGEPLIVRTWRAASRAETVDRVMVATEDERILRAVRDAGGEAVMTDPALPSGSDRVWAAAERTDAGIIVNLQGDEPLLEAGVVDRAVRLLLEDDRFDVSTPAAPLQREELNNPNVVKIAVADSGRALYFSRAPIPWPRDTEPPRDLYHRHVGLYVYRRAALEAFCGWAPSPLEQCEKLEQLRLLEHDVAVGVVRVDSAGVGVDTEEDLLRVRGIFRRQQGKGAGPGTA